MGEGRQFREIAARAALTSLMRCTGVSAIGGEFLIAEHRQPFLEAELEQSRNVMRLPVQYGNIRGRRCFDRFIIHIVAYRIGEHISRLKRQPFLHRAEIEIAHGTI